MREGWKGQKIQWMDTNNVIESISDTCGYKTLTHLDDDDDCCYYHSWRNHVVIAFGFLSSFLT